MQTVNELKIHFDFKSKLGNRNIKDKWNEIDGSPISPIHRKA